MDLKSDVLTLQNQCPKVNPSVSKISLPLHGRASPQNKKHPAPHQTACTLPPARTKVKSIPFPACPFLYYIPFSFVLTANTALHFPKAIQKPCIPELCIYQAVAISSAIPVDFTNAPVSQTIPVPRLVSTMLPLGYTERSAAHMI